MFATLAVTCVILVQTPNGDICIKPDGNINFPADIELDETSRQFWEGLAYMFPHVLGPDCRQIIGPIPTERSK